MWRFFYVGGAGMDPTFLSYAQDTKNADFQQLLLFRFLNTVYMFKC